MEERAFPQADLRAGRVANYGHDDPVSLTKCPFLHRNTFSWYPIIQFGLSTLDQWRGDNKCTLQTRVCAPGLFVHRKRSGETSTR
jgi:hypothetical protein